MTVQDLVEIVRNSRFYIKDDVYRGVVWYICSNVPQYRCGYILLEEREWGIISKNETLKFKVHGGITCYEYDEEDGVICLGFDCGHLNDLPDKTLYRHSVSETVEFKTMKDVLEVFQSLFEPVFSDIKPGVRSIKGTDFVETELKRLVDQLYLWKEGQNE